MKGPSGRASRFANDTEKAGLEDWKKGRQVKAPGRRRRRQSPALPSKKGAGWSGSLKQRARAAQGLPQAVVKVTSYNSGVKNAGRRMEYAARENDDTLETERGEIVEGKGEIRALAEEWAADFGTRKRSRDTMALIVSVPAETDKAAAHKAARAFLAETFGDNHRYVFAGHDDTKHYHVHVVVKMRGENGRQLRTDRVVLQGWRESFAEAAKEQGIMLDASPRYARGKGRKAPPRPVYQMRARGEVPEVDRAAAAEAVAAARQGRATTDFEQRQAATNGRERVEYARQAASVAVAAGGIEDEAKRVRAMETAGRLADFARSMAVPASRRQTLIDTMDKRAGDPRPVPGRQEAEPYLTATAERLDRLREEVADPALARRARNAAALAAGRTSARSREIER